MTRYDPFAAGPHTPRVRTVELVDERRGRRFPCDVWSPTDTTSPGPGSPVVLYSHHAGGHRRVATFLCRHLAGHGYVVGAMDHSEVVVDELRGREGETAVQREGRIDAIVASRVPDLRLLLELLLGAGGSDPAVPDLRLDAERVGLVGHSFGGWAVLATPDVEARVRAVVAHAPGGSGARRPGILPLDLTFAWGRDVPTLLLAGDEDVPVPLADVVEVYERIPATRRMAVLRRADHQHFVDDIALVHEAVRTEPLAGDAAWIPAAMRPITELCSQAHAHLFVRGLTLAHLDATLRDSVDARRFLDGGAEGELRARGVEAAVLSPGVPRQVV